MKMPAAAFPLLKLGGVLVRQISKPIANTLKERAKSHPFFRTYVCMPPAQFYNWCEIKLKMWILNLGKPVNIPILSESMAIELGANLLGEGIVFVVGAAVLLLEYRRSTKKDIAKEHTRQDELKNLLLHLQELSLKVEEQDTKIRELNRSVADLGSRKIGFGFLNTRSKTDPPDSSPPAPTANPVAPTMNKPELISTPVKIEYTKSKSVEQQPVGLLLTVVQTLQDDIIGRDDNTCREDCLVTKALLYIQQDVYRRAIAV